jgi:hypothetical protein
VGALDSTRERRLVTNLTACRRYACAAASLVVLLGPLAAAAQYSPRPDTLRFRETTSSEARVTSAQGDVPVRSDHDAVLAVVRVGVDSVHARYESLAVSATSRAGVRQPATAPVLRRPFTVRMDLRGTVTVLRRDSTVNTYAR